MTRLEELTLALADGALSESEARELAELLLDPAARAAHLELLRIEGLLRGRRENLDLREAVLHRLATTGQRDVRPAVMRRIARLPAPDWRRGCGRSWRRPALWAAAACLAALAVAALIFLQSPEFAARLEQADGVVEVERGSRRLPAGGGLALQVGDIIRTGRGATARIVYTKEATHFTIRENAELRAENPRYGKRWRLERGEVEVTAAAQPAGRPLRLLTRQAEAAVVGTRFALVGRNHSTLLEVLEGRVELQRIRDGARVLVGAGEFAVAAVGLELAARTRANAADSRGPQPIPINLFSAFNASRTWLIEGDTIRQTAAATGYREFGIPAVEGTCLIEATARPTGLEAAAVGGSRGWGFGVEARFGQRKDIHYKLEIRQQGTTEALARIARFEEAVTTSPLKAASGETYEIKFLIERVRPGVARLRGKIWRGTEPAEWALDHEAAIDQPLTELLLTTRRAACTFSRLRLSLIE